MANIEEIEGIGPVYAEKLRAIGITSTEELLAAGGTPKGRQDTAEKSGLADSLILKWTNHADLMRINGVGKQYAELLEAAGVDTVKELRNRRADNLAAKMEEVNGVKKICGATPSLSAVTKWIEEAKALEVKMFYTSAGM